MILDLPTIILFVAISVGLISTGGLMSSLINRRHLRKIDKALHELGLKVDHTNKNAKTVKVALDHFNAKAAAKALEPSEVTIINSVEAPVPVKEAEGK